MQNNKISYSSKTKYHNIYKKTNWGNFLYTPETDERYFNMVIENRNSFISDYYIKKHVSPPSNTISKFRHMLECSNKLNIDHVEIYLQHNGKILFVNNPYCSCEESKKRLYDDGWEEIYNLYIPGTKTFIKSYEKKEISEIIKKHEKEMKKKKMIF